MLQNMGGLVNSSNRRSKILLFAVGFMTTMLKLICIDNLHLVEKKRKRKRKTKIGNVYQAANSLMQNLFPKIIM